MTSLTPSGSTSSSSSASSVLRPRRASGRCASSPSRSGRSSRPFRRHRSGWTSVRPGTCPGDCPWTCPIVDVSQLTRIVRGGRTSATVTTTHRPRTTSSSTSPIDERLERVEDGPLRGVDVVAPHLHCGRPERRDADALRATRRRVVRPAFASSSTTPATTSASACTCQLLEPADRSYAEGQFAIVERGLEPEGGYGEVADPDVSGVRLRRRGRHRAAPRPRHRVRGRRRRARADRAPLDRLDQPQREPVRARSRRPRDPDPGGTAARPAFILVRVLPERRLDRSNRPSAYRHPFLTGRRNGGGRRAPIAQPALCSRATERRPDRATSRDRARIVNESDAPQTVHFAGRELELRPWEIRRSRFELVSATQTPTRRPTSEASMRLCDPLSRCVARSCWLLHLPPMASEAQAVEHSAGPGARELTG